MHNIGMTREATSTIGRISGEYGVNHESAVSAYSLAIAYEKLVNPSFWDMVRSNKRRQEFNRVFRSYSRSLKHMLSDEVVDMSEEDKRATVTARVIEQKYLVQRIVADELSAKHPVRGKIAKWFGEKSPVTKGVLTGASMFVLGSTLGTIAGSTMLNRLGRTHTDVHAEAVNDIQDQAELDLEDALEDREYLYIDTVLGDMKRSFDQEISAIREPLEKDARAMLIGGVVGSIAVNSLMALTAPPATGTVVVH